jgi:hypothetical protein
VERLVDTPGVLTYCIRNGVSLFSCSGGYPCSLGRLLDARKVPDQDAFIAGLNAFLRDNPPE